MKRRLRYDKQKWFRKHGIPVPEMYERKATSGNRGEDYGIDGIGPMELRAFDMDGKGTVATVRRRLHEWALCKGYKLRTWATDGKMFVARYDRGGDDASDT